MVRTTSAGQVVLEPSQTSATSHKPVEALHSVPALPAKCSQIPEPSQRSVVHVSPSASHAVTGDAKPFAGHAAVEPSQVSAGSQIPFPPRHSVPMVRTTSAGQVALEPSQTSATSHEPAEALHTVVTSSNVQPSVQQAPPSQSSPGSTVLSPQTALGMWGVTSAKVEPSLTSSSPTPWLVLRSICNRTKVNSNSLTLPRFAWAAAVAGSLLSTGSIHSHASSLPPEKSTRTTRKCWSLGLKEGSARLVLPSASASPNRVLGESLPPCPKKRPSPSPTLWILAEL